MAIDTEVKRKSIAAIANPWNAPVVVPNSTIDNPDRQAIGWSYAGIAAAAPGGTAKGTVFRSPVLVPTVVR